MNWSDLESIWHRQEPTTATEVDLSALKQTFEVKRRKLARSLLRRDLLEAGTGLYLVCSFTYKAWHGGKAYWPYGLAILLILGVTAFFILERMRARRMRLGPDAPLLAKLTADIDELLHQRRLLLNVAIWYIAPLMTAWAIVLATNFFNKPQLLDGRRHEVFWVSYIIFTALFTWGVWALNRRHARKKIEPRLIELEKLRAHLLSSK